MNPIALFMVGLGILTLGVGIMRAVKRKTTSGLLLGLLGVGILAVPLLATWFLGATQP